MKQKQTKDRIFIIPEDSYNERTKNLASMYSMLKKIIRMTRMTGKLAMDGNDVKCRFEWLLKRCDQFDALSDLILKASNIPASYVKSMDSAELEGKKTQEVFFASYCYMNDDTDDDFDDDYGDVYDSGLWFCDGSHAPDYMEIERMADAIYEFKEEATDCAIRTADVLKTADELLEDVEELKYRLDR